jgi:hypothetical protein
MKAAKRSPAGGVDQIAKQAADAVPAAEAGGENQPDDGEAKGQEDPEEEAATEDEEEKVS